MKDFIFELHNPEEVDQFLKQFPLCAFFKAGSCHKTSQGYGYVEKGLQKYTPIPMGIVRVVDFRPASNYIAELTSIIHQSPQFILMVNGKPVFDLDNWDITPVALEAGLNQHLSPVGVKPTAEVATKTETSDISTYITLLEKFVNNEIEEQDFEYKWLIAFQCDSSLRSIEEFDKLNSLFGDVDLALSKKQSLSTSEPETLVNLPKSESLKNKAANLLESLKMTVN